MMQTKIRISPIDARIIQPSSLTVEAQEQGYAFIERLIDEAKTGKNTFEEAGECFCGVFADDVLVGCGGINQDPYIDQKVGRLRHVYILSKFRRQGIASALVKDLLSRSKASFGIIRLRTSDRGADAFYEALGFDRIDHESATHRIEI